MAKGAAKRVIQFCLDERTSSGVNTFCAELDRELVAQGVSSMIVRSVAALEAAPRPEVLHLHGLWLRPLHCAAAWARRRGIPVVWSTHGMTAPWALGHKRWKKLPSWFVYQRRDLLSARKLHCTSAAEVAWNAAALSLDAADCRFVVAPLGTHLPDLSAADMTRSGDTKEFMVLFVGRIYPVKGLENLLGAAARLRDEPIGFRIVGPDEAGHRAVLERMVRELKLRSVTFAGECPRAALGAEYAACDLLVLPSHSENFGASVVDALAWGKVVVASTGTPWSVLRGERCGWWTPNDPDSLAAAIRSAAKLSPAERAEMGARGRALVVRDYAWSAVASRLSAAYAELIG